MSLAAPTVRFSIGSAAPMESKSLVDMSLDDLIKARRSEDKDTSQKKRVSIKSPANSKNKKPTQAQKSVAISKAKRGAITDARRGLSPNPKPTPMQIEKEVKRQQHHGSAVTPNNRKGTRSSRRKPLVDSKGNRGNKNSLAIPKNAVNAALKAMSDFGYKPPDGMKIVISFAPTDAPEFFGNNQRKTKQQQAQQKSKQQQAQEKNKQQQQNKNTRGRGGRSS